MKDYQKISGVCSDIIIKAQCTKFLQRRWYIANIVLPFQIVSAFVFHDKRTEGH